MDRKMVTHAAHRKAVNACDFALWRGENENALPAVYGTWSG